jgi:phospholipase/carboxylesterase
VTTDPHKNGLLLQEGAALGTATGAVVLLHGRGASAEDILQLGRALYLPGLAFLAPEAAGHSWYPESFLAPIEANEPFLSSALARVGAVVKMAHEDGVPVEKIVICGFSQGACLSTEFVARFPRRYGGLIAFTGGLVGPPGSKLTQGGSLEGMPAFFGSGDPDPHVHWARVRDSAVILESMGAQVTKKRYPGRSHMITQDEINEAKFMIKGVFGGM